MTLGNKHKPKWIDLRKILLGKYSQPCDYQSNLWRRQSQPGWPVSSVQSVACGELWPTSQSMPVIPAWTGCQPMGNKMSKLTMHTDMLPEAKTAAEYTSKKFYFKKLGNKEALVFNNAHFQNLKGETKTNAAFTVQFTQSNIHSSSILQPREKMCYVLCSHTVIKMTGLPVLLPLTE